MKKFFYTLWISAYPLIIYTAIQFLLAIIVSFFVIILGGYPGAVASLGAVESFISRNVLPITASGAVFTSVFLILFFYLDGQKGRIEKKKSSNATDFVMAIIGGAGIAIILNILIGLTGISGIDNTFQEISEAIKSTPIVITIICAGIIIPIVEEIIFRGLIFNRIKFQYNLTAAMLISSVVFGIYHGNIIQGIYATMLGVCLAYTYNKTKNILIPIFIHISANTSVLGLSSLVENDDSALTVGIMVLVTLIFAIIGIVYFIKRKVE